jgi:DNA repair protein RecO (recombination protein O)
VASGEQVKMITELIILHSTKFGENSIVAHTLSKEYGRRSFLIRGVGKRGTMTLMLPLTILEAEIVETSKSTLYTARNLSAKYPLSGIRNSIAKNSMTLFMSEVLYRTIKEGANEQGLFEWCEKNILLLDAMQSDFSNFHIRFLLELAVVLGFSPESQDLMPFVREHYPLVERFMKESMADAMLIPLNGAIRNEIAEEILRYIEYHSESAVNVASLKVLRELFV